MHRRLHLALLVGALSLGHAFIMPGPAAHGTGRPSTLVRRAEQGPVEKLFSVFFGKTVDKPLGFDRITLEKAPERFRATTERWAEAVRVVFVTTSLRMTVIMVPRPNAWAVMPGVVEVKGDSRDVALIRPLLAQTRLEETPLKLVYDANKDGWDKKAFHRKVDNQGSGVVVCKTKGGAICGGYNPEGWEGVGDERAAIAAFLFTWRDGRTNTRPLKLPKVGGADYAVDDSPYLAVKFGYEDLLIKLSPGPDVKKAVSKIGLAYAKGADGINTLFTKQEGKYAELVDLKVYVPAKR